MNIYVLKGPNSTDFPENLNEIQQFLANSIRSGASRFGWSYMSDADLKKLQTKPWQKMNDHERDCWKKANFLLGVIKGDWVVHVNIPTWGRCIAGQVSETYSFDMDENKFEDFRHLLGIDLSTVVEFDRNDDRVLPIISSRLKLQGRYWTIQYIEDFEQTIQNLKSGPSIKKGNESPGLFYLKKDLSPLLREMSNKIQKNHPGGQLESLIADVIKNVPNVIDVVKHGQHKGWGTDNGADLIVKYNSGLSISNLVKQEILVVQVKSFTGEHWETNAVEQIEVAIKEFGADAGLIVTTAESTVNLEKAIENLSNKLSQEGSDNGINKPTPIALIAGEDVAKFVLKYGGDLLF